MIPHVSLRLALAAATLSWLASSANAQTILYSDNFDGRTEGSGDPNGNPAGPENGFSSWGDNNNALGGTETFTYITTPDRGGGCNQVVDGMVGSNCNGITRIPFDVLPSAPNGFSIQLDFQRDHQYNNLPGLLDDAGNGFMSIGLGNDPDPLTGEGPNSNVDNRTDFTFLFQQEVLPNEGNSQFLEDGVLINPTLNTDPGPIDYGNPAAQHSVLITLVPQVAGAYGDNDDVDFIVVVDGDTVNKSFSSTVKGGDNFGYLSLSSNAAIHRAWDNLIVTALEVTGQAGDADGDLDVDGTDFLILQRDNPSGIPTWDANYGAGTAVASVGSVPEPSALALLVPMLAGCLSRRHR